MQHNDLLPSRRKASYIDAPTSSIYTEKFKDLHTELWARLTLRHTINCKKILNDNPEFKKEFFSLRGKEGLDQAMRVIRTCFITTDKDYGNFIGYYLANLDVAFVKIIETKLDNDVRSTYFKIDELRHNLVKDHLQKLEKSQPKVPEIPIPPAPPITQPTDSEIEAFIASVFKP